MSCRLQERECLYVALRDKPARKESRANRAQPVRAHTKAHAKQVTPAPKNNSTESLAALKKPYKKQEMRQTRQ